MEINEEMLDNNPSINYNIFNALNIINEDLGEQYLQTGFNPFDSDFELDEAFVFGVLENNKKAEELKSPDFINNGEKSTKTAFANSQTNCANILAALEQKLEDKTLTLEQKTELKKLIAYIKMFIELLNMYSQKLKKDKNALQMYKKLMSLNWSLGDLLKDSFEKDYDYMQIVNQILMQLNSKQILINEENEKLKQQASEIIKANLKKKEIQDLIQKEKADVAQKAAKEQVAAKEEVKQEHEEKKEPEKKAPEKEALEKQEEPKQQEAITPNAEEALQNELRQELMEENTSAGFNGGSNNNNTKDEDLSR